VNLLSNIFGFIVNLGLAGVRCLVCREPPSLLPAGQADVGGSDRGHSSQRCFYLLLRFGSSQEVVAGRRAETSK